MNYIEKTIERLKKLNDILEKVHDMKNTQHVSNIDFTELDSVIKDVLDIRGGLECALKEVNPLLKDIENFNFDLERYRLLKKDEQAVVALGYDFYHEDFSSTGSCYMSIIKEGKTLFIVRISDHDLSEKNFLPKGVINKFPVKRVSNYLELFIYEYEKMTDEEKKYLWTDRLMSKIK